MENQIVYFMKHIGISAVKIGRTDEANLNLRFDAMKVYSPYGAELIGIIKTEDAKKLEAELHKKFAYNRIMGEWFNVSEIEIRQLIIQNKKSQLINRRSVSLGREVNSKMQDESIKDKILTLFKSGINRSQISKDLGTPYSYVSKIINNNSPEMRYKKFIK
jgi:DNA helicase IV